MEDIETRGAIVRAMYECISGPANQERDWSRLASLLYPGARFTRTSVGPDGNLQAKVMDLNAYRENTSEYFRNNSFYEVEVARRIEWFGSIAHVFSTYESRHHPEEVRAFQRGINSIQLLKDEAGWRVFSVLWVHEREGLPIPETYLPAR